MGPSEILTLDEIQTSRSVAEMSVWIESKCEQYAATTECKKYFRNREGLTKQLMEEVVPLSRFGLGKFGESSEVFLEPVIGSQPYDAIVRTESYQFKVETTFAMDGYQEHHRMQILNENRSVAAWGEIEVSGTKSTGHEYAVRNNVSSDEEIFGRYMADIAAAHKHKTTRDYEGVETLIIGFEDFLGFTFDGSKESFIEILSSLSSESKGSFDEIWVVGVSGNFCYAI